MTWQFQFSCSLLYDKKIYWIRFHINAEWPPTMIIKGDFIGGWLFSDSSLTVRAWYKCQSRILQKKCPWRKTLYALLAKSRQKCSKERPKIGPNAWTIYGVAAGNICTKLFSKSKWQTPNYRFELNKSIIYVFFFFNFKNQPLKKSPVIIVILWKKMYVCSQRKLNSLLTICERLVKYQIHILPTNMEGTLNMCRRISTRHVHFPKCSKANVKNVNEFFENLVVSSSLNRLEIRNHLNINIQQS